MTALYRCQVKILQILSTNSIWKGNFVTVNQNRYWFHSGTEEPKPWMPHIQQQGYSRGHPHLGHQPHLYLESSSGTTHSKKTGQVRPHKKFPLINDIKTKYNFLGKFSPDNWAITFSRSALSNPLAPRQKEFDPKNKNSRLCIRWPPAQAGPYKGHSCQHLEVTNTQALAVINPRAAPFSHREQHIRCLLKHECKKDNREWGHAEINCTGPWGASTHLTNGPVVSSHLVEGLCKSHWRQLVLCSPLIRSSSTSGKGMPREDRR